MYVLNVRKKSEHASELFYGGFYLLLFFVSVLTPSNLVDSVILNICPSSCANLVRMNILNISAGS